MLAFFEQGGDQKCNIENLRQSMLVEQNVFLKIKCEEIPNSELSSHSKTL